MNTVLPQYLCSCDLWSGMLDHLTSCKMEYLCYCNCNGILCWVVGAGLCMRGCGYHAVGAELWVLGCGSQAVGAGL